MSEPTTAAEALRAAAEASGVDISKGIQRQRHRDPEGLLLKALARQGWRLVGPADPNPPTYSDIRAAWEAELRKPQRIVVPQPTPTTTPSTSARPGPPSAPVEGCPACTDRERA